MVVSRLCVATDIGKWKEAAAQLMQHVGGIDSAFQ